MTAPCKIFTLDFPLFVKWYITGKCNLRCSHCYLTDYSKEAPLELVLSTIDLMAQKGVVGIAFLGGEPFARGDFVSIVEHCSKNGIDTKAATNGTLITPEIVTALKKSGMRRIQISLEGHSPEHNDPHRGSGSFTKAILAAELLKNAGFYTSLSFTLSHANASTLEAIFECAATVHADELKLAAFVPVGTGNTIRSHYMLSAADVETIKHSLPLLAQRFPNLAVDSEFLPKSPFRKSCSTFGCGAGTNSIVINNDMTVSACDILTEEDRSSEAITSPSDLERLWKSDPIFGKWRGKACGGDKTKTITDFSEVHQHGCHVAYATYGTNILS